MRLEVSVQLWNLLIRLLQRRKPKLSILLDRTIDFESERAGLQLVAEASSAQVSSLQVVSSESCEDFADELFQLWSLVQLLLQHFR